MRGTVALSGPLRDDVHLPSVAASEPEP
jgi:hypothetical protein